MEKKNLEDLLRNISPKFNNELSTEKIQLNKRLFLFLINRCVVPSSITFGEDVLETSCVTLESNRVTIGYIYFKNAKKVGSLRKLFISRDIYYEVGLTIDVCRSKIEELEQLGWTRVISFVALQGALPVPVSIQKEIENFHKRFDKLELFMEELVGLKKRFEQNDPFIQKTESLRDELVPEISEELSNEILKKSKN